MDWTAMLAGAAIAYTVYEAPRFFIGRPARAEEEDAPVVSPAE